MNKSTLSQHLECYEEKRDNLSSTLKGKDLVDEVKIRLQKDTSNLFRPKTKGDHDAKLDVSKFNNIIHVDREKLIADVEGMTTYENLVNETLKYSCLPTVVPELKSITIGGALSGCGIESSSFRYGLVHETIKEFDVLLSDGTVVLCSSNNEHRDLFYAFPNTFGTLGYALKVRVKLIPVKNYVKVTHRKYIDLLHFFSELEKLCEQGRTSKNLDYIEGVIFSPDEMYITSGEFVDDVPYINDYRYRKIYYSSIQNKEIDYLTTLDYIWRWDPDWFWCSDVFFMQNSLIRLLFGKVLLGSKRFAKIMHFFHRHPILQRMLNVFYGKQESIIQDISIPIDRAAEFYDFFYRNIGIHPIWICPTKGYCQEDHFDFCPKDADKLYLDFGFWKSIPTDKEDGYYNKMIEKMVTKVGGLKSLYSLSYYTEEEFWALYDESKYRKIKKIYDPANRLRDFYQKCTTKK